MRHESALIAIAASLAGAFLAGAGAFGDHPDELRIGLILAGLLLLLLALHLHRLLRRPHPHMRRHSIVRLRLREIEARARAGEPFELPLGRKSVVVRVDPSPVTLETARIIGGRDGRPSGEAPQPVGEVITFAGRAERDEKSEVRLTITERWLSGYVLTDEEWWFIEPLRKFRLDAAPDEHIAYRTRDLRFKLDLSRCEVPPREASGGDGEQDPPHRVNPVVPIAMVHDEDYSWQAFGEPYAQQQGLINAVNGLYSQLGCQFQISVFIWTVNWLTSTNAHTMLDQVEDVVRSVWTDLRRVANRQSFRTEVAHATTGKRLRDNILGVAFRPGVYGLSHNQLVWVGGGGLFGGPPNLAFQNMMIAAHELGHNFNGIHEEADEVCVSHFLWCWDYRRTVMWRSFYDDNYARFSNGSRSAARNNAGRISTNMATGRNTNF